METERFRITLDDPEKTYFSGQLIKGEIWMNLTKRVRIRAIKVQLTGKGKCKWIEIMRKESLNESSRSLFYSSKEIYVHDEQALSFFEPRGVELGIGEHSFDFRVPLPINLPSSFKGSYGSIKYKLRIVIQKPWSFDEKHHLALNIVKRVLVPLERHRNPTPLTKQITKTISLFGNRPITLVCELPADFAVRNENIKLLVSVVNNSNMSVEKLKFSILQLITYYSHIPLRIHKQECVVLFQKETGNVLKKSERTFAHELPLPACQPSDEQLSGVINIGYEMRVEAVLRGFFKNLIMTLPFQVYSDDAELHSTAPVPTPTMPPPSYNNDIGTGNPFETTPTTYAELECSVGSSASMLSQNSEESSSMHSTTSDSSALTLSPAATGSMAQSCGANSGSSSQYNSPSARSSLRDSFCGSVPYMPYSSSPVMVNSYPPANLVPHTATAAASNSPQYSRMNSVLETSPMVSFLLRPQDARSSRIQDLPPSYDELFGMATAPEETSK